ncbi:MAG: NADH-quinone oxidoreductase subunit D [Thermodesulfobacteriota bacterium]|jgi:NADH-quinone oxidoreductase subunit D/NADH-quinone oxidoreductase subunit C/D
MADQQTASPVVTTENGIALAVPPGFNIKRREGHTDEYFLNMGPQHPSTHGVLRLMLRMDGENVLEVVPHLGYIHRGLEKIGENQTYLQNIHLTDRLDYLSSFMNNLALCLTIEKAMGIGVPERGEYIRVMACELQRIQSHLLWWGVFGMDLGAITSFLYGFKEREMITDIFEEMCGARLTMNFFRPGGSFVDVPDTFIPRVKAVVEKMKTAIDEYDTLLTNNVIMHLRTKGIGVLSAEAALAYGCSGPVLRGSGVALDVRRSDPYSIYDRFDFDIPVGTVGDCFDRYKVRMEEMRQSIRILEQAVRYFPGGPHRSPRIANYKVPAGSHYSQVETARGLLGVYLEADGGPKPYRIKYRTPSFSNLSVLNDLAAGHKIADLVPIIATLDVVIPDIDR